VFSDAVGVVQSSGLDDGGIVRVESCSMRMGTGARALRTEMETILSDAMFEAQGSSVKFVLVTEAVANRSEKAVYLVRGQGGRAGSLVVNTLDWPNATVLGSPLKMAAKSGDTAETPL
jgi:hypothetical protein